MFHHTVLLELNPNFAGEAEAAFRELAARVLNECSGTHVYTLRRNEAKSGGAYDHVLFSVFTDRAAFADYDRSDLHGLIKAVLSPHLVSLVVADAEVSSE